jgi:hypothetical protein
LNQTTPDAATNMEKLLACFIITFYSESLVSGSVAKVAMLALERFVQSAFDLLFVAVRK